MCKKLILHGGHWSGKSQGKNRVREVRGFSISQGNFCQIKFLRFLVRKFKKKILGKSQGNFLTHFSGHHVLHLQKMLFINYII